MDFQPEPEAGADEPSPTDPAPQSAATDDDAGQLDASHAGEPDIAVYRNVQIELRADGIFIRDRQFASRGRGPQLHRPRPRPRPALAAPPLRRRALSSNH